MSAGGADDPITHVVYGGDGSRGGRGETASLDDGGSALLNVSDEGTLDPFVVSNLGSGDLTINGGVGGIRVLGGGVVSPDDDVLDGRRREASLGSKESLGSVMVKTSHGSEVVLGDGGRAGLSDEGVGVGGVADNQNLNRLLAVLVQSSSLLTEDGGILSQQLLALHVRATREGTDQEGVVQISEGLLDVSSGDDACISRDIQKQRVELMYQ